MTRSLIVNADDYGFTPGVSAGIRRAHRDGIVTSTTAMMNKPDAVPAIHAAMEETPTLAIGVHLVLTAGRPLLPADRLKSVTRPNGRFPRPPDLARLAGEMRIGEVTAEWRAQIEAFLATGAALDHLDSHHHTSYLVPQLFEAMLSLAQEYGCPIRWPLPTRIQHPPASPGEPDPAEQALAEFGVEPLARSGVHHPQAFFGDFFADGATPEGLRRILHRLPGDGATSELMCHPGLVDDALRQTSGYVEPRERELEILTASGLKDELAGRGIRLTTFASL